MQPVVHIQQDQLEKAILSWTHELAPHGFFTTDADLNITSWNQWLERHSSLPASQVVGRSLFDIIPSLAERRLEQYFHNALKGEAKILSTALHEFLLPMPPSISGVGFSHMQQSARIAPLMLDGQVWGTITIVEDVTEREWQNAVLRRDRQREELLSAILSQLLSGHDSGLPLRDIFSQISSFLRLDVCLHYHYDGKAHRLFLDSAAGLTSQQMEDVSLFELGEGLIGVAARHNRFVLVNDVQSSDDPKALLFKNLELGSFLVFPLRVADKLLGVLAFGSRRRDAFAREITAFLQSVSQYVAVASQRLLFEEGLRESEERFRELADTVPDVIFTATPGGGFDFINQRFYQETALSAENALGFGWLQCVHPEDRQAVEAKWRTSIQTGQPYSAEYRLRLKGNKFRWMVIRARAIRDQAGKTTKWFGALTDVDELKNTQLELAQAQIRLKRYAENLEETVLDRTASLRETISHLESFSYTVAHDLRAPMRSVEGFVSLVLEEHGSKLSEEVTSLLNRVLRAAQRMDGLTRDVLNYTKASTEAVELQAVNVEALLNDIIDTNQALQAPRASIAIVRPLHSVIAHPTLLLQCLSNLLDNAVKFVRPDEAPRVIVRSELLPLPTDSAGRSAPPRNVRLWLEDNGIGMDDLTRSKIFGIFERGRGTDQIPGTGIGLAIVAKAVQRMRGNYGVESEVDRGSRFWIELTAAPIDAT